MIDSPKYRLRLMLFVIVLFYVQYGVGVVGSILEGAYLISVFSVIGMLITIALGVWVYRILKLIDLDLQEDMNGKKRSHKRSRYCSL
jgi:hypothetical protein